MREVASTRPYGLREADKTLIIVAWQGEDCAEEEFFGLHAGIMIKALELLEVPTTTQNLLHSTNIATDRSTMLCSNNARLY